MRVGDILYFAPGVRFRDVDLKGARLPEQYRARMMGLYVEPAEACATSGQALVRASVDAYTELLNRDGVARQALANALTRDHGLRIVFVSASLVVS